MKPGSLWAYAYLLTMGGCLTPGCSMFDGHIKQMDLLRGMAADVTSRIEDGSYGQFSASGQGLNPGITVEAAIVYRATARYEGVAGQFSASGAGRMSNRTLPPEILAIVNDASISDAERTRIIREMLTNASTNGP